MFPSSLHRGSLGPSPFFFFFFLHSLPLSLPLGACAADTMDFFYAVNAADLTPLKTELVDLVSSCLMKEPPFEAVRSDQLSFPRAEQHVAQQVNDGVATVSHMRELVHLISRQDGEFVLKLALHTRRTLHLRSSPNYLVALCAREPNCVPFLQAYMEQIVQIPSDWLSIANFAYFYDCDAAHDFSRCLVQQDAEEGSSVRSSTRKTFRAASPSGSVARGHGSPSRASRETGSTASATATTTSRHATPLPESKGRATSKKRGAAADPTRAYLPTVLRTSLVHCFAKFTPFSLSKADNEAAEHRAHRQERRRQRKAEARASVLPFTGCSDADDEDGSSDSGESDATEDDEEKTAGAESPSSAPAPPPQPPRRRKLTFTYKLLIRKLHITQPAFVVCCLLGKRYPATAQEFRQMGLHLTDPSWKPSQKLTYKAPTKSAKGQKGKRAATAAAAAVEGTAKSEKEEGEEATAAAVEMQPYCVFAESLAGSRMRLPVAQTWETLLSKEGNKGRVWDFLIASRAVAYMALLRNLRNILTRTCSAATHRLVLEKLVDEQQVALSQQLPYRFYSAYLAVREVERAVQLLAHPLPPQPARERAGRGRGRGGRAGGGRGRARGGGRGGASPDPVLRELHERVRQAYASFESLQVARGVLPRYVPLYKAALDSAINTAARLNVIPMAGTSIVIFCITQALLESMSATGAAAETASTQRKIDVAALLIAMLMRGCEHCVVLLYCYDEYVVFREADVVATAGEDGVAAEGSESDSGSSGDGDDADEDDKEGRGADVLDPESPSTASTASDRLGTPRSPQQQQQSQRGLGFMALVTALVRESTHLLARKMRNAPLQRQQQQQQHVNTPVATSFDMFADGSGAQFPYAFLDEVMERAMRVESIFVFDEGEHRTYAHMNRNAPAFGDLPTYLTRLRRTCSPDLVYAGVNIKASSPPPTLQTTTTTTTASPAATGAAHSALQRAVVRQRFAHHNDLLLTGFSDAILRLVAERMGGGALPVIERAAETYHVARFSARAGQEALAERARAFKIVSALREDEAQAANSAAAATAVVALEAHQGAPQHQRDTPVRPNASVLSAVTLPSFDAQGKMVTTAAWEEVDWGHKARRSERQLRQLTGSSAGLSSSAASAASMSGPGELQGISSGGDGALAVTGGSGPAALPSIRRLFSKQSTVEAESTRTTTTPSDGATQHRSHASATAASEAGEAAWLVPEGKQVSPIYHPKPFISLVKLLSTSAASTATGVTSPPPSAAAESRRGKSMKSRTAAGAAAGDVTPATPLRVVRRLLTSYRVCRFFISSTFLDMNNERNAITLDVFPRLRRWAAEAGLKVTLLEVDLRWGIPAVATTRNLSTSVCLNEVSRCSPFFLGMIGARYGSCPPTPLQLVVDEDVEATDYDWMTELDDPHVSVTELEMRHAMYNTRRRLGTSTSNAASASTALFFARDDERLMASFSPADGAARRVYEGDSATSAQSIARLKQRIAASGCRLTHYVATYANCVGASPAGSGVAAASNNSGAVTAAAATTADNGEGVIARHGGGAGAASLSSTRAMLDDDLGHWAVRGGRALDSVGPTSHTTDSNRDTAGSLWSFVKSRLSEGDEPKVLTSMNVPLDMGDFSMKVFHALQEVIKEVCGVQDEANDGEKALAVQEADGDAAVGDAGGARGMQGKAREAASTVAPASASAASADLYEALVVAQHEYARTLSALYAAPRGLLEQLSSFAVTGTVDATPTTSAAATSSLSSAGPPIEPPNAQERSRRRSMSARSATAAETIDISINGSNAEDTRMRSTSAATAPQRQQMQRDGSSSYNRTRRYSTRTAAARSEAGRSILLLEGEDGDGKSSALAALTERVLLPMQAALASAEARPFLFYSAQAGDDSVRSLLLFLATSYRALFHLYAEMAVQEGDSVEQLLLALDQAYATIHRRFESAVASSADGNANGNGDASAAGPAALVVLLDGLDKSSEAPELLSLLGSILHPLAAPHIRFIVSAHPRSPLAAALRTRTPAARVVPLPLLHEGERAQLVRLHLAAYGKLLEESFSADELKELLRKAGAGRPSRLISAITYLRLFSTFATLRDDIRSLPASATQLYVKFFGQLQTRFDAATCRLVLTLLLLRHPVGGILEFNLYRLVSNVAVASRLVALLRGICLDSHHGRLFITSAAFVAAVAHTYLPFASDFQSAQERVLVAELRYQPVDLTLDEQEVRHALRRTREAIERTAVDPLAPCPFNPERYAPRELLGVLQGSVQASRLDVTATLVCYLPFLECLILNRRMLSQLIGLLSGVMHATRRSGAASASDMTRAGNFAGDSLDRETAEYAGDSSSGIGATRTDSGGMPLQWRHYRAEVRRIGNVVSFLQTHYHILLRQPSLLRQCVWNALERDSCISPYDRASTARLQRCLQGQAGLAAALPVCVDDRDKFIAAESVGLGGLPTASTSADAAAAAAGVGDVSAMWVHWLNLRQHGGDTRLQLTTASPLAIRCMAISPDGAEVALGSDDGFVRRVSAGEEEEEEQQQPSAAGSAAATGGRNRLASTLRHESAVAAVLYVSQQSSDAAKPSTRTFGSSSASAASAAPPQLLVSGCVRGIVYVWNLEDNSLLQRGTGHLRSVSGLVCHPLDPSLLCSCGHDSYVLLWNLCGAQTQLSDEVRTAIALRLPKYPAGSPERRQQQRLLASGGGGTAAYNENSRGRGAAAIFQSSLAARSTAARAQYLTALTAFHTERQHRTPVSCIDFHGTGDIMASGSWDGVLILYNTRELCTPPAVVPRTAPASQPAPGTADAKRWRVRHGPEYRQVAFRASAFHLGSPVRALSFSASLAVTCVVGCHNGAVNVVDYASRAIVARWTSLHTAPITRVLASPDGRCVASADEHGVVRLTHLGISGSVFATLNGHQGAVTGLGFRTQAESAAEVLRAPQQVLLTAGDDRTLQAWRVTRGGSAAAKSASASRCLATSHSTAVTAVATSEDGLRLVTGSADGTAIVFCVPEEEEDTGDSMTGWGIETPAGDSASALVRRRRAASRYSGASSAWRSRLASPAAITNTTPMVPSFVLRHDDCRITCIRFALTDTRIVVGVAFGLLYVWSASPGLNRIEGRLLLRVRVPECGLYPVVAIGVRESVSGASPSSTSSPAFSPDASGVLSEHSLLERRGRSDRHHHHSGSGTDTAGAPAAAAAAKVAALVTAVCANGNVAVLRLLDDTTSRVMAADQNRRRYLQHSAQATRPGASNTSTSSSTAHNAEEAKRTAARTEDTPFAPLPFPAVPSQVDSRLPYFAFPPPPQQLNHQQSMMPAVVNSGNSTSCNNVPPPPRPAVVLKATTAAIPPQCFLPPTRQETAVRRRTLDRRAAKLQRLLARCRVTEEELRDGFQLELHRHRLVWMDSAAADEISAVVWLSPPSAASAATTSEAAGVSRHRHTLALVVAQRKVCLLASNGHETAVSNGLPVHIPHATPDTAVVAHDEQNGLPEEGATAARTLVNEEEEKEEAPRSAAAFYAAASPTTAVAAATPHDRTQEVVVDFDYLLRGDEYFTTASAAVLVATTATTQPQSDNSRTTATLQKGETAAASAPVLNAGVGTAQGVTHANVFAVALTTSRGEVLLLRVQVPVVHRSSGPNHQHQGQQDDHSSIAAHRAAAELTTHIVPATRVHLCQRLSFAKLSSSTAANMDAADATAAAAETGGAATAGPATVQRMPVSPLATTVQLSALPGHVITRHSHAPGSIDEKITAATPMLRENDSSRIVERVALVAGCSDGSARLWVVPTSPLASRGPRGSHADSFRGKAPAATDIPVGCFFCTSAVSVVSPLMPPPSLMRSSGRGRPSLRPASAAPPQQQVSMQQQPTRWVVGDSLGNVYQLQLEHDAPGEDLTQLGRPSFPPVASRTESYRLGSLDGAFSSFQRNSCGEAGSRFGALVQAAVGDRSPWTSTLGRLVGMMDQPPSVEVLQAMLAAPMLSGGGASSAGAGEGPAQTPADWLTHVDLSAPVASTLLKRSRRTSASSATTQAAVAAATAAAQTREDNARVVGITQPFLNANSFKTAACLPAEQWSILPDLPTALRPSMTSATATTKAHSAFFDAAFGKQPLMHISPPAAEAGGEPSMKALASGALSAPPAPLPSFGTDAYRTSVADGARRTCAADSEAASAIDLETPLADVLAAYRRSGVEDDMTRLTAALALSTASSTQQQHQQQQPASSLLSARLRSASPPPADAACEGARPSVRFTLPPSSPTPPPSLSASAAARHSDPLKNTSPCTPDVHGGIASDGDGEEEEEKDFFAILYDAGPRFVAGAAPVAAARRAWLLQQQEVLKEAMRVQRYNKDARAALKAYQQRISSVVRL